MLHLRRCKNSPDKSRQLVAKANGGTAEQVQQLLAILSSEEAAAEANTLDQPLKRLKSLATEGAESQSTEGKKLQETEEAQRQSAAAKNLEEKEAVKPESESEVAKDLDLKQAQDSGENSCRTPKQKET